MQLKKDSKNIDAKIEALKASLRRMKEGPDAALAQLNDRDDPETIRIRLALLVEAKRFQEAVDVLRNLQFHERWCDLAVTALAENGDIAKAKEITQKAENLQDRTVYRRCVVRLSDALFVQTLRSHHSGESIRPFDVTDDERRGLTDVAELLSPSVAEIKATHYVSSELDAAAVKLAVQVAQLLGNRSTVEDLFNLLYTRHPILFEVARGAISEYFKPQKDIVTRMRSEHPLDFEAHVLASVVQTVCFHEYEEAFAEAEKLVPKADSPEKKKNLFTLFEQIKQSMPEETLSKYEAMYRKIIEHLLADSPSLFKMWQAGEHLRKTSPDQALPLLDAVRDEADLYWLQLYSTALIQKGMNKEAVVYLEKATLFAPSLGLLRKTAMEALKSGLTEKGQEMCVKILHLDPNDVVARQNLANILIGKGDFAGAVEHYRKLHELESQNSAHAISLAISLVRSGDLETALGVYNEILLAAKTTQQAVFGKAQVLKSLGRIQEAFDSLEAVRPDLWADPAFVSAYMSFAYSAGEDDKAHEALVQLLALRTEGRISDDVMRPVTIDDGMDQFKQMMKGQQEQNQKIHEEMLKGKAPWLWAEEMSRNPSYWGWWKRIQALLWIGDDPINRATFSIYSTNGFHARTSDDKNKELLPLECPPKGTQIVADLSALITLHRLGLLDVALEYFDKITVPMSYFSFLMQEADRLMPAQVSQQTNAEAIKSAIDDKKIVVMEDSGSTGKRPMPLVDEYSMSENEHLYHIRDLLKPLLDAGRLSQTEYEHTLHAASKPAGADAGHPELRLLDKLQIDLTTLEVLTGFGLLNLIATQFSVHVTKDVPEELATKLKVFELREEVRKWHMELSEKIRHDKRFVAVPHAAPPGPKKDKNQPDDYPIAFHAAILAQQIGLPLLADDRVCQAFTLNERQGADYAAFGTDVVAVALGKAGILKQEQAANILFQLMEWRYRFILPPPDILKLWAVEFAQHPPGRFLQQVASYMHDCMRDTGLFGGLEQTDPPVSMATRLFLSWLTNVVELIGLVWTDERYTSENAKKMTVWIINEFLPSSPRVMPGQAKERISTMLPRTVIAHLMILSGRVQDPKRIGEALRAVKTALHLTDQAYMNIVTEVLNDVDRKR